MVVLGNESIKYCKQILIQKNVHLAHPDTGPIGGNIIFPSATDMASVALDDETKLSLHMVLFNGLWNAEHHPQEFHD